MGIRLHNAEIERKVTIALGHRGAAITVRLPAMAVLIVTVVDKSGVPVPDALVRVQHPSGTPPSFLEMTDQTGRAQFALTVQKWNVGINTIDGDLGPWEPQPLKRKVKPQLVSLTVAKETHVKLTQRPDG